MKKSFLLLMLAACLCLTGMVNISGATVLTFDDLTPCSTGDCGVIGSYGGLTWDSNFRYVNTLGFTPSGYVNGTVSGNYVAYNSGGRVASVGDTSFDFNGAYLTGAWNNGLNIQVIGLKSGSVLYNSTVFASAYAPTWFQFNYVGVDELIFRSSGGLP